MMTNKGRQMSVAAAEYAIAKWMYSEGVGPLDLSYLELTELPPIPDAVQELYCVGNALIALPTPLPSHLKVLIAAHNRLASLPSPLPDSLLYLDVRHNHLTTLPPLPPNLEQLYCSYNPLLDRSLPGPTEWPPRLHTLWCTHNRLCFFPDVPDHVVRRRIGVCYTYRPYLLWGNQPCPCCGYPAGTFGTLQVKSIK